MIDFGLSEEEELIRRTARTFAEEQLRACEREHERSGVAPDLARQYSELGFSTIDLPQPLGGQGLGLFTKCLAAEELARGDAGAVVALDGIAPAAYFLAELPTDDARRLLASLAREPGRRAVLFTDWERDLTIDNGRGSGTIAWVPAHRVDLLVLHQRGKAYVLSDGLRIEPIDACGLRAAGAGQLRLESARMTHVIEDAAKLTRGVARTRCYAAALLLGIARAAMEYAARYTQDRVVFGKPIAHHQAPAFLLADMRTGIEAAHLALWRAATLVDRGEPDALVAAAGAFGEAADQALFVTQHAVQLLGGHGFITDHPVEKWMRDARTLALLWGGRDGALGEAGSGLWPAPLSSTQPREAAHP